MSARRGLRWTLAGIALVVVLAAALAAWLLRSEGGRDWTLARVAASLPAGSTLQWQGLEGRVSGPLVIHGLDYRQPDGLRVQAARVRIDHSVWPLLSRRWQVRRLDANALRITLPRSDEAFQWPSWPEVLPTLELPLSMAVQDARLDGVTLVRGGEELLRLDRLRAALTLGPGELSLRGLQANGPRIRASGTVAYRPAENYRSSVDLKVLRVGPKAPAGAGWRLLAHGDLDDFTATLGGLGPVELSARLRLQDGSGVPRWQATLRSGGVRPAWLGLADEALWRGEVTVAGRGGEATVDGRLDRAGLAVGLDGTRLRAADGGLALAPLALALPQGPLRATGKLDFSETPTALALQVTSPGLRLVATEAGSPDVLASGTLGVQGTFERWTLVGEVGLQRGEDKARLAVRGRGDSQGLVLDRVEGRTPGGRLDGDGALQWSPTLGGRADLRLAGFDPGFLAPDFPGALDGRITVTADRGADGQWSGSLQAPSLSGQLRGRALQANARASWVDGQGDGELVLALGASRLRVEGRFGSVYDLRARAQPLDLADLWPQAHGRLRGTLAVRGSSASPRLEADLVGSDLRWGSFAARELQLRGRLPDAPARGQLDARLRGLELAGQAFDRAELHLQGNRRAFELRGDLAGAVGLLQFAGQARHDGAHWRGQLARLRVAPARGAGWSLQGPTDWGYGDQGLTFGRACLRQEDGPGQACGELANDVATVSGQALRIGLVEPWLGAGLADYESYGTVGFDGRLVRSGQDWSGHLQLQSDAGGVRLRAAPDTPLLAYRDLTLRLEVRDSRLQARGGAQLSGGGELRLRAEGGLDADAPLSGTLELDVRNLAWMELLSPDLAAPSGRVQGQLVLAGTRADPRIGGEARLIDFGAQLPALGVGVSDGNVRLAGEPGGTLRIIGSLRAGEGQLAIEGGLDLGAERQPLRVSLTGDNLKVADTPELEATVSPRLQLRYLDGELQLRGSVAVPRARVDLEGLDRGIAPSDDVVVLDPRNPEAREGGLVFDTEVTVRVGRDVRLRGFGLDGRLGGELAIRDRPGRPATANGSLTVNGRYRAYGRDLRIRRARLSWVNAAYDNPVLDVLAEHEFEEVTVGVRVRGTAQAPQTSVTSTPSMSTAEALSWLLLGRPLETASGTETQRISASAAALSAGSSLLAQRLGVQLGLDSAGIMESRALGGSTLVLGKRLSPRLFVSYGVSLLGTGQVVMLKYMLRRGLSLGLESGTVETAASLDWRKEK